MIEAVLMYLLAHGVDCFGTNTFCTLFVGNNTTIAYVCYDNRQWTGPHRPTIYAKVGNAIIIEPDVCRTA